MRLSLLFLAFAVTAGSPAFAQVERASLTGVVLGPSGAPVPGVVVSAMQTLLETSVETKTDAKGAFGFSDLRPGPYQISASVGKDGAVVEVTLTAGQAANITLRLQSGVVPPASPSQEPAPAPSVPPEITKTPDFVPVPDRWRLEFPEWQRYPRELSGEYPYVQGRKLDPYNQNVLKGDRPAIGDDVFFVLTAISETVVEYRRVPTPSGVSTEREDSEEFFGHSDQYAVLPTAVLSVELFKGDTAFKPRSWAVRVTPVFNLNYVNTKERNVLSVTPADGRTRRRQDIALQEGFGELKLFDVGPDYDFVSIRAGIQPFNSDFRGFLFRDTNLGFRLFGTWGRNRNQWNVAMFDQLEKETNSELNLLERRNQRVVVANYYRQDFLTKGYTISPSFHANFDDGDELFYDANGFLVRPAPIGFVSPHRVRAYYAGIGGDGHIGRLNITHQYYRAFGRDDLNGIAGREVDIGAQFAVAELSVDRDWYRIKGTFLFASGDGAPSDDKAKGFDAIFDNPNIAGGPASFWNRQGIRLAQTAVGLVGRSSVLPSLRTSKTEGQASFVNPGVFLYNAGFDAELTRKLRMAVNANYLRFHQTEPLEAVLFQPGIDKAIGYDVGVGFQYRPKLNDNILVNTGVSVFKPGLGFKQILTGELLFTPFAAVTFTY